MKLTVLRAWDFILFVHYQLVRFNIFPLWMTNVFLKSLSSWINGEKAFFVKQHSRLIIYYWISKKAVWKQHKHVLQSMSSLNHLKLGWKEKHSSTNRLYKKSKNTFGHLSLTSGNRFYPYSHPHPRPNDVYHFLDYRLCYDVTSKRFIAASFISQTFLFQVWELATGQRLLTLRYHSDGVTCMQFNDFAIVSGSYDRTVKLWDFTPKHPYLETLYWSDNLRRLLALRCLGKCVRCMIVFRSRCLWRNRPSWTVWLHSKHPCLRHLFKLYQQRDCTFNNCDVLLSLCIISVVNPGGFESRKSSGRNPL